MAGDTNGKWDVCVRDRKTGQTTRVGVRSSGEEGALGTWSPTISADGRFVAFSLSAKNLADGETNDCMDVFAARNPLLPGSR